MNTTGRTKLGMPAGPPDAGRGVFDRGERFVIRTPNAEFGGTRAGCRFAGGAAYTNDPAQADACRGLGYTVEDRQAAAAPKP